VRVALVTVSDRAWANQDVFLEYHRRAGVDVVIVGGATDGVATAAQDDYVRSIPSTSETTLARAAADEFGADWVIPSTPEEFWWPRGESLKDVLAVIPPRYAVVQALVRPFVSSPSASAGSDVLTRTTRFSLLGPDGAKGAALQDLLRPVYRASAGMEIDPADWTLGGRRVPLRAWYPVEVFRYATDLAPLAEAEVETGLADGSLVTDTRLQEAVRAGSGYRFTVPTIVDDASYAVECAAVGEVDLVQLDRQIRALEQRIGELEARFWPTVRRQLRRLARRPS